MNDLAIWIVVVLIGLTAFSMGWNLRGTYEEPKRRGLEAAAQEEAAAEYERGCRDGFQHGIQEGVAAGVRAAKGIHRNRIVLGELAAKRFYVGGMQPHE